MKDFVIICTAVAMNVAGCEKKENSNTLIETPSVSAVAAATAASSTPSSSPSIQVEEDFEQKAEATISASNLDQEVQKLKREIGR